MWKMWLLDNTGDPLFVQIFWFKPDYRQTFFYWNHSCLCSSSPKLTPHEDHLLTLLKCVQVLHVVIEPNTTSLRWYPQIGAGIHEHNSLIRSSFFTFVPFLSGDPWPSPASSRTLQNQKQIIVLSSVAHCLVICVLSGPRVPRMSLCPAAFSLPAAFTPLLHWLNSV